MHKTRRRIFTAVFTALFVLSISYFALLAPTTAWFYQETVPTDFNYPFAFKKFDESFSGSIGTESMRLRAATRFADVGEWLFDEVIHVVRVSTTNSGTVGTDLTGLVKVKVTDGNDAELNNGIRWFAYCTGTGAGEAIATSLSEPLTGGTKGPYKTAIENTLTNDFGVVLQDFKALGETNYSGTYFTKAATALTAHNKEGFVIAPGETKYIYVVFWAEYGDLKGQNALDGLLSRTDGVGDSWNSTLYTANISIEARPYVGMYGISSTDKQLKFNNNTGSDVIVTVKEAGKTAAQYTILSSGAGGNIRKSDNSVVQYITLHEDAQCRIQSASGSHFTIAQYTANTGGHTSARLTGTNNTVCAVEQMESNLTLNVVSDE